MSAQISKNALFQVRAQSYAPGRPTPQSLTADVEALLAGGGKIDVLPGFTEPVLRPVVPRTEQYPSVRDKRLQAAPRPLPVDPGYRPRQTVAVAGIPDCYLTISETASVLGISAEGVRSRLKRGSDPQPAWRGLRGNGSQAVGFDLADVLRHVGARK